MKVKRKIFIPVIIAAALLICLIPIKSQRKVKGEIVSYEEGGGGTAIYSAILYKVIVWNETYLERPFDSSFKTRTGTDFYFFPFNFGDKEWRSK